MSARGAIELHATALTHRVIDSDPCNRRKSCMLWRACAVLTGVNQNSTRCVPAISARREIDGTSSCFDLRQAWGVAWGHPTRWPTDRGGCVLRLTSAGTCVLWTQCILIAVHGVCTYLPAKIISGHGDNRDHTDRLLLSPSKKALKAIFEEGLMDMEGLIIIKKRIDSLTIYH